MLAPIQHAAVPTPLAPPCGADQAPAVAQEQFEFDEPDFALIDTLFSLAEAHLFMQLVTLHDADPGAIPGSKQLPDMYRPAPVPPPPACSCGIAAWQQQHTAISAAIRHTGSVRVLCDREWGSHHQQLQGAECLHMCRDVRAAVDRCHRDGSLKKAVAADPAKYIHEVCCTWLPSWQ